MDKKLPTRQENFSEWYNQVVLRAELADYAPVRGCMVVRPMAGLSGRTSKRRSMSALKLPAT